MRDLSSSSKKTKQEATKSKWKMSFPFQQRYQPPSENCVCTCKGMAIKRNNKPALSNLRQNLLSPVYVSPVSYEDIHNRLSPEKQKEMISVVRDPSKPLAIFLRYFFVVHPCDFPINKAIHYLIGKMPNFLF